MPRIDRKTFTMSYSIHHPTEKSCLTELRYPDTLRRKSRIFSDGVDANENRHIRVGYTKIKQKNEFVFYI